MEAPPVPVDLYSVALIGLFVTRSLRSQFQTLLAAQVAAVSIQVAAHTTNIQLLCADKTLKIGRPRYAAQDAIRLGSATDQRAIFNRGNRTTCKRDLEAEFSLSQLAILEQKFCQSV